MVTYPLSPLYDATLFSGLTALVLYAGGFLLCGGTLLMLLTLLDRQNTWAWPQWRLGNAYSYMSVLLSFYLLFQILVLSLVSRNCLVAAIFFSALFVPCCGFALLSASPLRELTVRGFAMLLALFCIAVSYALALWEIVAHGLDSEHRWFACLIPTLGAVLVAIFAALSWLRALLRVICGSTIARATRVRSRS